MNILRSLIFDPSQSPSLLRWTKIFRTVPLVPFESLLLDPLLFELFELFEPVFFSIGFDTGFAAGSFAAAAGFVVAITTGSVITAVTSSHLDRLVS